MSSTVYFKRVDRTMTVDVIQSLSRKVLETVVDAEGITFGKTVPLKVHFGEHKNKTFIKPENYLGIIDFFAKKGIESCYLETSALYGGQRYKKELHEQTAKAHGFTQLPIVFADGEHGEHFAEVAIDKKHFQSFKVAKSALDYDQMLVISHFKGHMLAGFGGAIKQLSMGLAAKGGKLAMHMGEKPQIKSKKCKQCDLCKTRCNVDALVIGPKSRIDHAKCVGCGACMAICPHQAITIFSVKNVFKALFGNPFIEKVVEGAYAAQKNKQNVYVNYAMSITPGCDCEPRTMKPVIDDLGIFASLDPVAIDKACFDMAKESGKRFRGSKAFAYAESIGLGTSNYALRNLD